MEAFLGELKDFMSNAELVWKPLKPMVGTMCCQGFKNVRYGLKYVYHHTNAPFSIQNIF